MDRKNTEQKAFNSFNQTYVSLKPVDLSAASHHHLVGGAKNSQQMIKGVGGETASLGLNLQNSGNNNTSVAVRSAKKSSMQRIINNGNGTHHFSTKIGSGFMAKKSKKSPDRNNLANGQSPSDLKVQGDLVMLNVRSQMSIQPRINEELERLAGTKSGLFQHRDSHHMETQADHEQPMMNHTTGGFLKETREVFPEPETPPYAKSPASPNQKMNLTTQSSQLIRPGSTDSKVQHNTSLKRDPSKANTDEDQNDEQLQNYRMDINVSRIAVVRNVNKDNEDRAECLSENALNTLKAKDSGTQMTGDFKRKTKTVMKNKDKRVEEQVSPEELMKDVFIQGQTINSPRVVQPQQSVLPQVDDPQKSQSPLLRHAGGQDNGNAGSTARIRLKNIGYSPEAFRSQSPSDIDDARDSPMKIRAYEHGGKSPQARKDSTIFRSNSDIPNSNSMSMPQKSAAVLQDIQGLTNLTNQVLEEPGSPQLVDQPCQVGSPLGTTELLVGVNDFSQNTSPMVEQATPLLRMIESPPVSPTNIAVGGKLASSVDHLKVSSIVQPSTVRISIEDIPSESPPKKPTLGSAGLQFAGSLDSKPQTVDTNAIAPSTANIFDDKEPGSNSPRVYDQILKQQQSQHSSVVNLQFDQSKVQFLPHQTDTNAQPNTKTASMVSLQAAPVATDGLNMNSSSSLMLATASPKGAGTTATSGSLPFRLTFQQLLKQSASSRGFLSPFTSEEQQVLMHRAIDFHETAFRKKYKNMTMYEKGKVQEMFLKMQREERDTDRQIAQANKVKEELAMCLNVKDMKIGNLPRNLQKVEHRLAQLGYENPNLTSDSASKENADLAKLTENSLQESRKFIEVLTKIQEDTLRDINHTENISPAQSSLALKPHGTTSNDTGEEVQHRITYLRSPDMSVVTLRKNESTIDHVPITTTKRTTSDVPQHLHLVKSGSIMTEKDLSEISTHFLHNKSSVIHNRYPFPPPQIPESNLPHGTSRAAINDSKFALKANERSSSDEHSGTRSPAPAPKLTKNGVIKEHLKDSHSPSRRNSMPSSTVVKDTVENALKVTSYQPTPFVQKSNLRTQLEEALRKSKTFYESEEHGSTMANQFIEGRAHESLQKFAIQNNSPRQWKSPPRQVSLQKQFIKTGEQPDFVVKSSRVGETLNAASSRELSLPQQQRSGRLPNRNKHYMTLEERDTQSPFEVKAVRVTINERKNSHFDQIGSLNELIEEANRTQQRQIQEDFASQQMVIAITPVDEEEPTSDAAAERQTNYAIQQITMNHQISQPRLGLVQKYAKEALKLQSMIQSRKESDQSYMTRADNNKSKSGNELIMARRHQNSTTEMRNESPTSHLNKDIQKELSQRVDNQTSMQEHLDGGVTEDVITLHKSHNGSKLIMNRGSTLMQKSAKNFSGEKTLKKIVKPYMKEFGLTAHQMAAGPGDQVQIVEGVEKRMVQQRNTQIVEVTELINVIEPQRDVTPMDLISKKEMAIQNDLGGITTVQSNTKVCAGSQVTISSKEGVDKSTKLAPSNVEITVRQSHTISPKRNAQSTIQSSVENTIHRKTTSLKRSFDNQVLESVIMDNNRSKLSLIETRNSNSVQKQSADNCFVDIRERYGQKNFVPFQAKSNRAERPIMGLGKSPMARHGQNVISFDNKKKFNKRNRSPVYKTPLDKLLTSAQLAEFQKFISEKPTHSTQQKRQKYVSPSPVMTPVKPDHIPMSAHGKSFEDQPLATDSQNLKYIQWNKEQPIQLTETFGGDDQQQNTTGGMVQTIPSYPLILNNQSMTQSQASIINQVNSLSTLQQAGQDQVLLSPTASRKDLWQVKKNNQILLSPTIDASMVSTPESKMAPVAGSASRGQSKAGRGSINVRDHADQTLNIKEQNTGSFGYYEPKTARNFRSTRYQNMSGLNEDMQMLGVSAVSMTSDKKSMASKQAGAQPVPPTEIISQSQDMAVMPSTIKLASSTLIQNNSMHQLGPDLPQSPVVLGNVATQAATTMINTQSMTPAAMNQEFKIVFSQVGSPSGGVHDSQSMGRHPRMNYNSTSQRSPIAAQKQTQVGLKQHFIFNDINNLKACMERNTKIAKPIFSPLK